ncbi:MAG TPA: hypothetical protein VGN60_08125 [Devosia sp.]|jgi:hypothetical protein|nr:hypothetical protein [Devosia sp.]
MVPLSKGDLIRILSVIVMCGLVGLPSVSATEYPTIVGSWYDPHHGVADCQSHWGMHIEPMGLLSGETRCDFVSVKRDGWKVTWTGQCMFGGADPERVSVIAIETDGILHMDFGGATGAQASRVAPQTDDPRRPTYRS